MTVKFSVSSYCSDPHKNPLPPLQTEQHTADGAEQPHGPGQRVPIQAFMATPNHYPQLPGTSPGSMLIATLWALTLLGSRLCKSSDPSLLLGEVGLDDHAIPWVQRIRNKSLAGTLRTPGPHSKWTSSGVGLLGYQNPLVAYGCTS